MENSKKDLIKTAIAAGIVFLLIATAIIVVFKYSVEGENTDMPFELSRIIIGSGIEGVPVEDENGQVSQTNIENNIVQKNGLYFEIKKSENYNKQATIKTMEIANIQIIKKPLKGELKIYFPSTKQNTEVADYFDYFDEYILDKNSLTYKGASKNNISDLEINNQGGIIAIAFGITDLGTYTVTEEETNVDGTMLKDLGISNEDISFIVNFDLILETGGKKYKTNIELNLPIDKITEKGTANLEITDTRKYVFKRM